MYPRIKYLEPCEDYLLHVVFDDGTAVLYDVKEDIQVLPGYQALVSIHGLFRQVQLDESRTCVYWNDDIDIPSDAIYQYGKHI